VVARRATQRSNDHQHAAKLVREKFEADLAKLDRQEENLVELSPMVELLRAESGPASTRSNESACDYPVNSTRSTIGSTSAWQSRLGSRAP
jgi:hypothetical protein